jgi:hypothetical protein
MPDSEIFIGSKVRLASQPPYFKTAEPMPMLRPPDLIPVGSEGVVMDRRPAGYWGIKFERGTFLLEAQYLALLTSESQTES